MTYSHVHLRGKSWEEQTERERDRERGRESKRERERKGAREREKDRDQERPREREIEQEREREREQERERERETEREHRTTFLSWTAFRYIYSAEPEKFKLHLYPGVCVCVNHTVSCPTHLLHGGLMQLVQV